MQRLFSSFADGWPGAGLLLLRLLGGSGLLYGGIVSARSAFDTAQMVPPVLAAALLRQGIAALVDLEPDMELVAQASTGREAIEQFRRHRPDITLMDLQMPDISGNLYRHTTASRAVERLKNRHRPAPSDGDRARCFESRR